MTNLARCKDCAALTLDTDEDAARHRGWHIDYDKKFRNTRNAAVEARDNLDGLRLTVKTLQDALDTAEPTEDPITVQDMPTDDELGLETTTEPDDQAVPVTDDQPASTYATDNDANTVQLNNFTASDITDGISGVYAPNRNMI